MSRRLKRGAAWGFGLAALVFLADRASKAWLIDVMQENGGPIELTPFFNLVMVWNRGISFGLFQADDTGRWLLVGLSLAIVVLLAVWLSRGETRAVMLALGAVIGGALGNVYDRIWLPQRAVADFFDLHVAGWHWPAFNIADAGITLGVLWLVVDSLRSDAQRTKT